MQEYKVRYEKETAEEVLSRIGAEKKDTVEQEDLYLLSDSQDIYRLVKKEDEISLVHFRKKETGFGMDMSKLLDTKASRALFNLFENKSSIVRKVRTRYFWKGSKLAIDVIQPLGEFLEIYPKDDEAKKVIFEKFDITKEQLITKSYYDLLKEYE